jgi:hypothetical protein
MLCCLSVHGSSRASAKSTHETPEAFTARLPVFDRNAEPVDADWLVRPIRRKAGLFSDNAGKDIVMSNGLISRRFRILPNCAAVALDNLMTGESMLRGVKPEAVVRIDGITFDIAGLKGQSDYAFLLDEWLDELKADPAAFRLVGCSVEKIKKRFEWKRTGYSADLPWPAPGIELKMDYTLPDEAIYDMDSELLDSSEGREFLAGDNFEELRGDWTIHTTGHDRSSFTCDRKVGAIYTPSNTCVYAERKLPSNTGLIQCYIDPGTDRTASWGPGIAAVFDNRIVKFYLRPGKKEFGIFDGSREITLGTVDPEKGYYLRLRIDSAVIHCEASNDNSNWFVVGRINAGSDLGSPTAVRLGKTSYTGGNNDFSEPGEYISCSVGRFIAYGPVDQDMLIKRKSDRRYLKDIAVSVHYEMYDGIPLMAKWLAINNNSPKPVTLDSFTIEMLALVEGSSSVDDTKGFVLPNMHVECDYEFHGMSSADANVAVNWLEDPQYSTQVNYLGKTPCLLECRPPVGPHITIDAGGSFESFRVYELIHDSTERERRGLAQRRMYRTAAPWITENPIMMHVRNARPDIVRNAIDQCAEVGFEMLILSFGSGFNIENEDPAYIAQMKELADYAHSKGIRFGGYSLLASRRINDQEDVVNPATGAPGGFAAFGNSPCIQSRWGQDYFRKLYAFFEKTGFDLLEHDGSYPGDLCASTKHPGHDGLADSQYKQWKTITDFYKWCRTRGVYLNVPDYYYLSGSTKSGMGYRETNWSLPRAQQIIHGRQNIYDGTWQKTPSMGWMFVPLTEYHGGGPAAAIEPLSEHLDAYEAHLANNFGLGVQACYRGPRLYDTDNTRELVAKWVAFYKKHRTILDSDLIHIRRADGRDIDCMMHVNPGLTEKGLLMIYNPTDRRITTELKINLYYTGLTETANIRREDAAPAVYTLDRDYNTGIPVEMTPRSVTWYVIE